MKNRKIYALGFFDGVHLGHQALLAACVALAKSEAAEPAAITFEKHPQSLFLDNPPPLINTVSDRQRLLRGFGITHVKTFPVTKEVMSTDWRVFLDSLVEQGAVGFVCGDDFRFGNRGEGNGRLLAQYCAEKGLPCVLVPEQTVDGTRVPAAEDRRTQRDGHRHGGRT